MLYLEPQYRLQMCYGWHMHTLGTHSGNTLMCQVQSQQRQDSELLRLIDYLENRILPKDPQEIKKVITWASKGYFLIDGVLYHESSDVPGRKRLVVPKHLQKPLLDEYHDAPFAGHFGVKKLAGRLAQYYYWVGMRSDTHKKCEGCVTCASVQGQGHRKRPACYNTRNGNRNGMKRNETMWSE